MGLRFFSAQCKDDGTFLIRKLLHDFALDSDFEGVINGFDDLRRGVFGNHDAKRFAHRQIRFDVRD